MALRQDHSFDRRESDVNVRAVATQVKAVAERVEAMDFELKANTILTKQIHTSTEDLVSAIEGTKEMWAFLSKWGKRLAIFLKYVGICAGAITAIWSAMHLRK